MTDVDIPFKRSIWPRRTDHDASKYPAFIAELYHQLGWDMFELAELTGGNILRVSVGAEEVSRELQAAGAAAVYDLPLRKALLLYTTCGQRGKEPVVRTRYWEVWACADRWPKVPVTSEYMSDKFNGDNGLF
ncbi:hypothetical protein BDN67DRAFT_983465 [Paxillus ammoniavirescens]|nr:hypothetical protein BDN67DRAFT_983465 [Paxillus ammoniavirescens]